ncbi:HicB family protein [Kaistia algarum]|uniref:type II toxin-antitoxin system HicB family antitoxin n=1 Tax=Kaistia algarum TaxID=2083279 RepID=UPI000CE8B176|nr:type II toxin-antitoxin system HicB family antitoxin [Kaistia algarum]MCX5516200.1 type II toxin-antitoxin system HicB family antitoxin [Kaistia algarum]PPE78274.1 HicB family protein [Kaistia algarum]
MDYPIVIAPLSEDDGGGYVALAPDLLGCMSDGETPGEAAVAIQRAIEEWIDLAKRRGMDVPAPGSASKRQAAEKATLLKELRAVATSIDAVEARVDAVERMVREIEEKIEHVGAWERFAVLAGVPAARETVRDKHPS